LIFVTKTNHRSDIVLSNMPYLHPHASKTGANHTSLYPLTGKARRLTLGRQQFSRLA